MHTVPKEHDETLELAQRLLQVLDAITKITEIRLSDDVFSLLRVNQVRTLHLLKYEPGISQKEVAERLHITQAAVSTTVRDLEVSGLVERQSDPADARQVKLYLSARGEGVISKGEEMRCNGVARVLSTLSIEEQRVIVEALERALATTQRNSNDV